MHLDRRAAAAESRALLGLAVPTILAQVANQLMGIVDTLMVSSLGTAALAATALGALWVHGTMLPAVGMLFGMDPIVSQAHGARDAKRSARALQQGLVLAVLLSLPVAALWMLTAPALRLAGQSPALASAAHDYAMAQVFSVPFFLAFIALRQHLAGRGIVRPAMWIAWAANVVNVVLNWALVFGHLGLEPRGIVGSGIATGLSRAFMLAALLAVVIRYDLHERALATWTRASLAWSGLRELVSHGIATGAQVGLEVWGFHVIGLMAGRLGADAVAAHAIVLNIASLTFMVPLGIGLAAATRVGNLVGAGDVAGARRASTLALAMGAGFMALSAASFVALRWQVPTLWQPTEAVLALAAGIMPIAGAFQIFDGLQVVGCGVLRGRGDTQAAAWFNLAGYYGLAIPLGWLAAFHWDLGLRGLWWGLVTGLVAVAVLLVARIRRSWRPGAATAS